jgi:hypothetical protein
MKNGCLRKVSKMERITDCIVRILYAGLVVVMVVIASVSLYNEQPFVNGFVLLISAIMLGALTLKFRQIELIWEKFKLRLKRE